MNLGQLEELTLDHNAITELPNSVRHLTALKVCPSFLDCLFVRVFMLLRDGEVLRGELAVEWCTGATRGEGNVMLLLFTARVVSTATGQSLSVAHNALERLPVGVWYLQRLTSLDASHNAIFEWSESEEDGEVEPSADDLDGCAFALFRFVSRYSTCGGLLNCFCFLFLFFGGKGGGVSQ